MSGSLVATITNIGHQVLSLEPSSHSVVNTLGFTPVGLQKDKTKYWITYAQRGNIFFEIYLEFVITITLMSDEFLGTFFDDLRTILRLDRHRSSAN